LQIPDGCIIFCQVEITAALRDAEIPVEQDDVMYSLAYRAVYLPDKALA
jgi:hypothetical protein